MILLVDFFPIVLLAAVTTGIYVLECNGDFPEHTDYNSPCPVCQTDVLGINRKCRKRQYWSPAQFLDLSDLCGIDQELNPYDTSPVDDLLLGHGHSWGPSVGFYCVQEEWENRIHEEGMYQPPGAKRTVEALTSAQVLALITAPLNTGVQDKQGGEEAAYGEIAYQDGANQEVPAFCNAAAQSISGLGTSHDNVGGCSSEAATPAAQPVIDLNPLTSTSHAAALQTLADWLLTEYPNLPPQQALAVASGTSQALADALATANEHPEQGIVEEAQGAQMIFTQLISAIQGEPESSSALKTLSDAANQLAQQLDAEVHTGQMNAGALLNPAYTTRRIADGLQAIVGPGLPLAESLRILHQVALRLTIWLSGNRPISASFFPRLLTGARVLAAALSRLAYTMGASSPTLVAQAQIAHDLVHQLVQIANSKGTDVSAQAQIMREITNALETEIPVASAEAIRLGLEAVAHQESVFNSVSESIDDDSPACSSNSSPSSSQQRLCRVRAPVRGRRGRAGRPARGGREGRQPRISMIIDTPTAVSGAIDAPNTAGRARGPGRPRGRLRGRPRGRPPGRPQGSNRRATELGVNINYGPVIGNGRGGRGAGRSRGALRPSLSQQLRDWSVED